MEIFVRRFIHRTESTLGYMLLDGEFYGFTLEDQRQTKKVKGETRIPAGRYEVRFREEPTPLTMKYRAKYDFFNWHLQIMNIPGFNSVYIHVGNYDEHTDGCLLLGLVADTYYGEEIEDSIGYSRVAYKKFYSKVKSAIDAGEKVKIQIVNEK